MGYDTERGREPTVGEDERVVFSEHGRSLNNVDFQSHWLMVVKDARDRYSLKVKHGGGEEAWGLGDKHRAGALESLSMLSSDERYLILYTMYGAISDTARAAKQDTARRYSTAFVEGRLKKRRKNGRVSVEIVDPRQVINEASHAEDVSH